MLLQRQQALENRLQGSGLGSRPAPCGRSRP